MRKSKRQNYMQCDHCKKHRLKNPLPTERTHPQHLSERKPVAWVSLGAYKATTAKGEPLRVVVKVCSPCYGMLLRDNREEDAYREIVEELKQRLYRNNVITKDELIK